MSKNIKNIDLLKQLVKKSDLEKIASEEEAMHLLLDKKVSENINQLDQDQLTLGEKVSDKVATVAGSWKFIITFLVILMIWIAVNSIALINSIDPFPFILLNLILSCIAALQAPIIMMSQNRQDAKDRIRSENDYKVDLKTELILEDLHQKIDTMIVNQIELKKKISEIEKNQKKS